MSDKKPNIVLIFADDLGYGDVSCFNENSKVKTKHLEGLAESGMIFTNTHATSALCTRPLRLAHRALQLAFEAEELRAAG